MGGSCRTPKNEPNAQYNKLFHESVRNALIPKQLQKYIKQLQAENEKLRSVIHDVIILSEEENIREFAEQALQGKKGSE